MSHSPWPEHSTSSFVPVVRVEIVVLLVPPARVSAVLVVVSSGRSPKFPLNSISIYVPVPVAHAVDAAALAPSVVMVTVTLAIVGSSSRAYLTDFVILRSGMEDAEAIPSRSETVTVLDATEDTVKLRVSLCAEEYSCIVSPLASLEVRSALTDVSVALPNVIEHYTVRRPIFFLKNKMKTKKEKRGYGE